MSKYIRTSLKLENGKIIYYNKNYLQSYKADLLKFLDGKDYMHTLDFAKDAMEAQEIKSNNEIEGFKDDIFQIEEVIREDSTISYKRKDRIINLHKGYRYILNNYKIDKENLKRLYAIISKDLLDEYSINNMGDYYRIKPVYIYSNGRLDLDVYEGMPAEKLEEYMNLFFDYVNSDNDKTEIDSFIKSQIMHFYFVYVHPYFDVNGRTSRTVAMWHLLNNKSYPYIIFNRAISFSSSKYIKSIINARERGDLTLFLKYMMQEVQYQLEKEKAILDIKESVPLTNSETQIIEYLLSLKSGLTIKDLSNRYNAFNIYKHPEEFAYEYIFPLMAKNVILNDGPTKHKINKQMPNLKISLNSDLIKQDNENKYLRLKKYTR